METESTKLENDSEKNKRRILVIGYKDEIDTAIFMEVVRRLEAEGNIVIIEETTEKVPSLEDLKISIPNDIKFDDVVLSNRLKSHVSQKDYEESFPSVNKPKQRPIEHNRIFRKQNR